MPFLRVETLQLYAPLRTSLMDLLGSLDANDWDRPTVCQGWTVHDIALHILGVDVGNVSSRRDGHHTFGPTNPAKAATWLAEFNDGWVRGARRISPRLLCELLDVSEVALEQHLATLDLSLVGATVSWASQDVVPVWLDVAREYTERWIHQQQIRDATDRPGCTEAAYISPVIATFVHALPLAFSGVEASEGVTVQLRVGGEGGGAWHVRYLGPGWDLDAGEATNPVAVVEMGSDDAWRMFTRNPRGQPPVIHGDPMLGSIVTRAVAIIG